MLGSFNLVMLVVADVARSLAFYRDRLGLTVTVDGPHWSQLDLGGGVSLGLHPAGADLRVTPDCGCSLSFATDAAGYETALASLRQAGLLVTDRRDESFGWLATCHDPDGYRVQFCCYR
ncbi:MAG: VOC family protein [Fimbriimonadaceae bacterium]|nr:VOC family protein [Fimbriimonadaceae bacterium]